MPHPTTEDVAKLYHRLAYGQNDASEAVSVGEWIKSAFVAAEGYQKVAAVWMRVVVITILAAFIAIIWAVQSSLPPAVAESDGYSSSSSSQSEAIPLIIIKAVLILIPILAFMRFAIRTYRINKHLEVTYSHRWALQQSLHSYMDAAGPAANHQCIIDQVLPFFFADIETGYISKKDGLGDKHADGGVSAALSKAVSRK